MTKMINVAHVELITATGNTTDEDVTITRPMTKYEEVRGYHQIEYLGGWVRFTWLDMESEKEIPPIKERVAFPAHMVAAVVESVEPA